MTRSQLTTALRLAVLERDGWRCRWCGRVSIPGEGGGLDVHHIRYRRGKADDVIDNLISLERRCHDLVHGLNPQLRIVKGDAQELLRALVATPAVTGLALLRQRDAVPAAQPRLTAAPLPRLPRKATA